MGGKQRDYLEGSPRVKQRDRLGGARCPYDDSVCEMVDGSDCACGCRAAGVVGARGCRTRPPVAAPFPALALGGGRPLPRQDRVRAGGRPGRVRGRVG